MDFPRPVLILFTIFSVLCIWACQNTDPIDNGIVIIEHECIDHDGDSYGVYCNAGLDCDDTDESIYADCDSDNPCTRPRAGCPCSINGDMIACGTSTPTVSEDGTELCYAGIRECVDEVWSTCEGVTSFSPVDDPEADPGTDSGAQRQPIIGTPNTCVGSCDSGCRRVYDCPSGIDLTAANSTNLRYDLALTVGMITYGAAVILEDGQVTGGFWREFSMVCPPGEMAQLWSIDFEFDFPDTTPGNDIQIFAYESGVSPVTVADDGGRVVVCPATFAGSCTRPSNPADNTNPADSNIASSPDAHESRLPNVMIYTTIDRANALLHSPRLRHYEVFYFCDDAS